MASAPRRRFLWRSGRSDAASASPTHGHGSIESGISVRARSAVVRSVGVRRRGAGPTKPIVTAEHHVTRPTAIPAVARVTAHASDLAERATRFSDLPQVHDQAGRRDRLHDVVRVEILSRLPGGFKLYCNLFAASWDRRRVDRYAHDSYYSAGTGLVATGTCTPRPLRRGVLDALVLLTPQHALGRVPRGSSASTMFAMSPE